MIVRGSTGVLEVLRLFLWRSRIAVVCLVLIELGAWQVHLRHPEIQASAIAAGAVGLLATVVGIFIAFRFNEAYNRWWEARILWGGVVNASRTLARQVTTLLTPDRLSGVDSPDEAHAAHRELVYRQLAWVNALRLSLRDQPIGAELEPFLDGDDRERVAAARNPVTQLAQRQSERLAELIGSDAPGQLLLNRLDTTMGNLTDLQGGLERIKNTAFPDRVIVVSRVFVWLVGIMVAFAFIEPQPRFVVFEMAVVLVVILAFILVKQLGDELNNPFDNRPNDTPMTALCRTIEIDLRQQLGERDLPEPIQPVDGVLM